MRPIPTLYGAFVLGAPTSDDVKRPEFTGLAIRRHIVRWLLSYAENEFECCVGLYSGGQFFSLQLNFVVHGRQVKCVKLYYLRHANIASDMRPTTTLRVNDCSPVGHHLGGQRWWEFIGSRFAVLADLGTVVATQRGVIEGAITSLLIKERLSGDDELQWVVRRRAGRGLVPYRKLDAHGVVTQRVVALASEVEDSDRFSQLLVMGDDKVGRGLWPQMRRAVMEEKSIKDCFVEGDPCPYMWIEECTAPASYDFSNFHQLLPTRGVFVLPCGREMAVHDPYLSRHRCTRDFLSIAEGREAPSAIPCVTCGLRYIHPLMAFFCCRRDRTYDFDSDPGWTSTASHSGHGGVAGEWDCGKSDSRFR